MRRLGWGALLGLLCSLLLTPPDARAVGLGQLNVHSSHGEPLRAEVGLVSMKAGELSELRVSVADVAAYERFGITRPDVLSSVDVSVDRKGGREPIVRIGSTEPIHELFLHVLLEIESRDTRLVREVIILLDPSVRFDAPPENPAGAVASTRNASTGTVYTVRAGDSLMRIAQRLAPASTSPEQMAVALYETNPEAFLGSIHRVISGAQLVVPSESVARTYSQSAARAAIRESIEDFKRRRPDGGTASANAAERKRTATTRAGASRGELAEAAGPVAASATLTLEDERALRDFQAVTVNLRGSLHELQGTLDERIELLETLHSQVDELIDERARLRELAEREAAVRAAADAARAREADAARVLAESVDTGENVPMANVPPAIRAIAEGETFPESGPASRDLGELLGIDPVWEADDPSLGAPGSPVVWEPPVETGPNGAEPLVPLAGGPGAGAAETAGGERNPTATRESGYPGPYRSDGETVAGSVANERSNGVAASSAPPASDEATGRPPEGDAAPVDASAPADASVSAGASAPAADWPLERIMGVLRDGGLLILALCMVYALLARRRKGGDDETPIDSPVLHVNPDDAIDYYMNQLPDRRMKEELLISVLADSPERQDIRLQLLGLYAEGGSTSLFVEEAQTMYRMTGGKSREWYRVVEMGLQLGDNIDFYKAVVEDEFDLELDLGLSDEDRVSSVPGGTDVLGGRRRGGLPDDVASFEELMELHNTVVATDELEFEAELDEVVVSEDGDAADADVATTRPEAAVPVPLEQRPVYVPEDPEELIEISVRYNYGMEKLDFDLGEADVGTDAEGEADLEFDVSIADAVPGPDAGRTADTGEVGTVEDADEVEDADFVEALEFFGEDDPADVMASSIDTALVLDADDERSLAAGFDELLTEPDERPGEFVAEFFEETPSLEEAPSVEDALSFDDESAPGDESASEGDAPELMVDLEFHTDDVDTNLDLAETYVDNFHFDEARELIAGILPVADAAQRQRADELLERAAASDTSEFAFG